MITSLSNASLHKYPSNTLTKFTHHLPSPIHLPTSKAFCISLRSLSLCNKLVDDSDIGYIKVHLSELNPKTSPALGDDQCLARIPFISNDSKSHSSTFWYDMQYPIPIQLTSCTVLQELNFLITDEDNNQLQLQSGPTTVLNLEVTEMEYTDQFSVTCNPFDSISFRSDNTNIDFHTFLPRGMVLKSGWEVALHSVVIPKHIHLDDEFIVDFNHDSGWHQQHKWKIQTAQNIKEEFAKHLLGWGIRVQYFPSYIFLESIKNLGKLQFNISGTLHFNEMLCRALGFKGQDKNGKGHSWMFDQNTKKSHTFFISSNTSLGVSIDHLALYSDIVSNSFIGNSEAPILDVLSTNSIGLLQNNSSTLFYVPQLTFRPISKIEFSSIHFMLYTLDGDRVEINDVNKKGISITLLFRKQNKHT